VASPGRSATSLALASHPLPTVAVTSMMAGLFAGAEKPVATVVVGTLAVLAGQLSIGWSNDAQDAARDRASGRSDKPVADGRLGASTVARAAWVALACCVVLSLLLGWRSGSLHLLGVACGWLYNLRAKYAAWSPLPFAVAFGALPAVAALANPDPALPPAWSVVAAALIGVAAHFGNVLPDIDEDRLAGVRGLPQRLGPDVSAVTGTAAAFVAVTVVVMAPAGPPTSAALIALAACAALAGAGLLGWWLGRRTEAVFGATIILAAVGVVLMAAGSTYP